MVDKLFVLVYLFGDLAKTKNTFLDLLSTRKHEWKKRSLFYLLINVIFVFLSGCGDGHRIYAWEDRWSYVQTVAGSIQELCHYFRSDEKCKYNRINIF